MKQGENRWIIIISKQPRGPFTEAEVKELLAQQIIRINDIAFRIDGENPTHNYEWKLLWQFPEFDRRKPPTETPTPAVPYDAPPEVKYERKAMPLEEIKRRTLENLPPELANLSLQDLIPRSTRVLEAARLEGTRESVVHQRRPESDSDERESRSGIGFKGIYGAAILLVISFLIFNFISEKHPFLQKSPPEISSRDEDNPQQNMSVGTSPGRRLGPVPLNPSEPPMAIRPDRRKRPPPQLAPDPPAERPPEEKTTASGGVSPGDDRGADESRRTEEERAPAEEGAEEGGGEEGNRTVPTKGDAQTQPASNPSEENSEDGPPNNAD